MCISNLPITLLNENGDAIISRSYTGPTDDFNKPHGIGIVTYLPTNEIYTASYCHGLPHSTDPACLSHTWISPDGLTFKGLIVHGKPIEGTVKTAEGYHFEGTFDEDYSPKEGTVFYYNNNNEPIGNWSGTFENGNRQGKGLMTYKDGSICRGLWVDDDIADGNVTLTLPNEHSFERELVDGFIISAIDDTDRCARNTCLAELYRG